MSAVLDSMMLAGEGSVGVTSHSAKKEAGAWKVQKTVDTVFVPKMAPRETSPHTAPDPLTSDSTSGRLWGPPRDSTGAASGPTLNVGGGYRSTVFINSANQ